MIHVSENAAKRIVYLKDEDGAATEAMLRVYVKKGGCSGFSYKLKFDTQVNQGDKIVDAANGAKVVVDGQSLLFIAGMTLDYEGGLNGKGFIFSNPNATKTCSCGTSFNVD